MFCKHTHNYSFPLNASGTGVEQNITTKATAPSGVFNDSVSSLHNYLKCNIAKIHKSMGCPVFSIQCTGIL